MNYQKHYKALVDRAVTRVICGYSERHHVIPKCLGGDESDVNIVRLTSESNKIALRDFSYMATPEYRQMQSEKMKQVWAARKLNLLRA